MEQGWNGEVGLKYTTQFFTTQATYYWQTIENFIQWVPVSGVIWSPQNVKQVSVQGVDISAGFYNTFDKVRLGLDLGYLFNTSRVTESSIPGDASIGKQLIYNPQNKFTIGYTMQVRSFRFLIGSVFTGYVYARSDNSIMSIVDGFVVFNTEASYRLDIKKTSLEIHVAVLNFTNENYQTIKNYPMPGINFTTGLTLIL